MLSLHIPAHPDGESGGIRTLNRKYPDTLLVDLICYSVFRKAVFFNTPLLDATCAPADIRYPTDLSLLNEAREKLEEMIDILHEPLRDSEKKPRTCRKKARRLYLKAAKNRKP